jgi:hypothetical protein
VQAAIRAQVPRRRNKPGTVKLVARWADMADPRNTDPEDRDPRERDLGRRSDAPAISPWLIIGALLLLGAAVYVISAMVVR